MTPDSVAIDATLPQLFTWTNNGSAQTDFILRIYKNVDSSLIYNSTKVTSPTSQFILPANSLANNNDYKYQLEVFSGSTSVLSDFIFLKTYATPILNITVPSTITNRAYRFTGDYTQAQNIPYSRYKFILYDNNDIVLVDSGWKYDYTIAFEQDGFLSDQTYKIELITESQYQMVTSTGKRIFAVLYTQPDAASYLTSTAENDTGGIRLEWSPVVQITGASVGTYYFTEGKFGQGIQIDPSSKIIFNKTVPSDFTIHLWVKLPVSFSGDIITLGSDEVKVGYNGTQFYLVADGNTAQSNLVIIPDEFIKIALKPEKVIVETSTYTIYL
jgi:hypothetical protein